MSKLDLRDMSGRQGVVRFGLLTLLFLLYLVSMRRFYGELVPFVGLLFAMTIFFVALVASRAKKIIARTMTLIIVLVIILLVSSIKSEYPFESTRFFIGTWYLLSPILFFMAFRGLEPSNREWNFVISAVLVLITAMTLVSFVDISIYGVVQTDFVRTFTFMRGQGSTIENVTVFPALLGVAVALCLYRSACSPVVNINQLILAVAFTLLVISTASRKTMIAVLIVWTLMLWYQFPRYRFVLLLGSLTLVFALSSLEFNSSIIERFASLDIYLARGANLDTPRVVMAQTSFELALRNFPLGVGPGMFASPAAAHFYSPLYAEFGIHGIYGLRQSDYLQGKANYLVDTFWPAVIAEFGALGTIIYIVTCTAPLYALFTAPKSQSRSRQPTAFLVGALFIICLVESLGGPFLISTQGLFIVGIMAMGAGRITENKKMFSREYRS